MTTEKKKKKALVQQQQPELIAVGSADYIASHEIDQIIKKGRDKIKHAITVSDEKLTKTKKEIVREMAVQLEQAGYPVNEICDRLSKSLKGLVNDRTVRDALDSKYKDQSQSQVAALQNHDGGSHYRQQEQLRKKAVKEITLDDINKGDFPKSKLKQVVKHQMQRADWWEQQAKQNEVTTPKQDEQQQNNEQPSEYEKNLVSDFNLVIADKDKIIEDLKKENEQLRKSVKSAQDLFMGMVNSQLSDAEIGHEIKKMARKWGLTKPKPKRSKTETMLETYKRLNPNDTVPEGLR